MYRPFSRRKNIRVISFLTAGLLVMSVVSLHLAAGNLAYERALSQSYARAFSTLAESVEKIDTSLEKSSYVTSPEMIGQLCTTIYGEARTAQQAVGELPYGSLELEQTAALVAKVGDYAQAVGRTASRSGAYDSEARENMEALRKLTARLAKQLDGLEEQLYDGTLQLDNVEAVEQRLSSVTEEGEILAGSRFEELESDFPTLPTLIYDGPFSDHLQSRKRNVLEGERSLSPKEAQKAASGFLEIPTVSLTAGVEVDGEIPCYYFQMGDEWAVEVTKQGGYVLSLTNGREIGAATLSHQQGVERARAYLKEHDISQMQETYYVDYGNRLTVNFAAVEGEALCYPDLIKVEVALDNGEIIGFESEGYLTNHIHRSIAPQVSRERAQQQVSDRLKVQSGRLAVIPTEGKNEVLCWEFTCKSGENRTYLVYINAETGKEQQILILLEDEHGSLTM